MLDFLEESKLDGKIEESTETLDVDVNEAEPNTMVTSSSSLSPTIDEIEKVAIKPEEVRALPETARDEEEVPVVMLKPEDTDKAKP